MRKKQINCMSIKFLAISKCSLRRVLLSHQMTNDSLFSWLGRPDTVSISLLCSAQRLPPPAPAHTCCLYFLEWMFHFSQDSRYVFLIMPSIKGLLLYLVRLGKVTAASRPSSNTDDAVCGGCSQRTHLSWRTLAGSHLPSVLSRKRYNSFNEVQHAS